MDCYLDYHDDCRERLPTVFTEAMERWWKESGLALLSEFELGLLLGARIQEIGALITDWLPDVFLAQTVRHRNKEAQQNDEGECFNWGEVELAPKGRLETREGQTRTTQS